MADFNQILDAGDVDGGIINVVVEIPAGSNHKIEWKRKVGALMLDRVEPLIFAKPTNYGFIPQTLDEDGDELDALISTDTPLPTGSTKVDHWGDINEAKQVIRDSQARWKAQ